MSLALRAFALCVCGASITRAQARGFQHAASYSFDAPTDLYLSEDPGGCGNHTQGVRSYGARVLAITLYPDAYCSLMQAASCRYTFAPNSARAFASREHGIRRSHFTATWDETCAGPKQRLAEVMQGVLTISDASDLGLQGTYDLALTSGVIVRGIFDSAQCAMPRGSFISCF